MLVRPLPMQVLIVDDDKDAVKLLHFALSNYLKEDVSIHMASNAAGALELMEASPIDLVISDLDMNEINGFHLLKSIKATDPTVQVIIATAHESPNAMRSALRLGVDDYFVKPFQPAQLIDSLLFLRDRRLRWQASGLLNPVPAAVSETT